MDSIHRWYLKSGKRLFDVVCSVLLLVVLSPVILAVAALVRLLLGAPVFFKQVRPGLDAMPFTIYKFRSMTDDRDSGGHLLPDGRRLTPFGKFLRSSSLDELPELINVLKGEMSLVGPRPLLLRYMPYFTERERARFLVRPGITGLAQVCGRNELPWDRRLSLDLEYIARCSPVLDLRLLLVTLARVFSRKGLQPDPTLSMLDFDEERRRAAAHSFEVR